MAIIKPYISSGAQSGQPVVLKIHEIVWLTVGNGTAIEVSDYEITIGGHVKLVVYKGDLEINIALLDEDEGSTKGPCSLQINAYLDESASYKTDGDDLIISAMFDGKDVQVKLSRSDPANVTECHISGPINLTLYIEAKAITDRESE